jgi:hypothetical protein
MMDDFSAAAERIREAFARDGEPQLGAGVVSALSAVFGGRGYHPLAGVDLEGMVAEGRAAVADMQARRKARYDRNAAARQQGLAAYELANRRRAAGLGPDQAVQEEFRLAACAWLNPPGQITVW